MEAIESTLGYKLIKLFKTLQVESNKDFQVLGITRTNYAFMYYIHKYPGILQEELSDITFRDQSVVWKGIDKLVEQGYTRRLRDKLDRSSYALYLTEEGEKIVLEYRALLDKGDNAFLQKLTDEERENFLKLFDKMLD